MEENNINEILEIENSQSPKNNNKNISENKYPTLRTIAGVYMFLSWIIGFIAFITTWSFLSEEKTRMYGFVSFIGGGLIALGLATISESLKVFLDIEYNTRKASGK